MSQEWPLTARAATRLILICQMQRVRRGRIIVSRFQGVVAGSIVVEGILKGIAIPVEAVRQMAQE